MRSHSYLNTAKTIIRSYNGDLPLSAWLKQFFKSDKKFGSKDRKNISHVCYCFYRLGNSFLHLKSEERMLIALSLCSDKPNKILEELKPERNETVFLPLSEKIRLVAAEEEVKNIFPFAGELSKDIEQELFHLSFLKQPNLFLRIRPGKRETVVQQLQTAGMAFTFLNDECVSLSNQSKVDEVVNIDEDVVVQDYNSQKTADLFANYKLQTINYKLLTTNY